jgi:hypothetical protein
MTTVRQIATRAGRIASQVNEGQATLQPYAADVALVTFNAMMRDMRGAQVGQPLSRDWNATAGITANPGGLYVVDVSTPDEPRNGDRIGVIGARTVTATEDTIEGAASVTTSEGTTWFYREDLADWKKEEDVGLDDESPLIGDCDEALAMMLAGRMYQERFGDLPAVLAGMAASGEGKVRQLYGARRAVRAPSPVLRGLAQRRFCA